MKMIAASLALLLLGAAGATAAPGASTSAQLRPSAEAQIAEQVATYIRSIDAADTKLGATVWATTAAASFIHPLGQERGWNQIASNFYGKTMGGTFSKRVLRRVGDLSIQLYGDAAVVQFNWDFVATQRANGQPLHTTGRESQVFVRQAGTDWRLVHVHYSGPPVSGPGQGF